MFLDTVKEKNAFIDVIESCRLLTFVNWNLWCCPLLVLSCQLHLRTRVSLSGHFGTKLDKMSTTHVLHHLKVAKGYYFKTLVN